MRFLEYTSILLALLTFILTTLPTPIVSQDLQPNETQFSLTQRVDFDVWLGMDEVSFTVGRPLRVGLYVKNTGTIVDSYNVTLQSLGNLFIVSQPTVIEEVFPNEVKMDIIEVIPITKGTHRIDVTVTSQTNTTITKTVSLTINSGIVASAPSKNNLFYLFLIIAPIIFLKLI